MFLLFCFCVHLAIFFCLVDTVKTNKLTIHFILFHFHTLSIEANRIHGFYGEVKRHYNFKLWKTFPDFFNCLPIAEINQEKNFIVMTILVQIYTHLNNLDVLQHQLMYLIQDYFMNFFGLIQIKIHYNTKKMIVVHRIRLMRNLLHGFEQHLILILFIEKISFFTTKRDTKLFFY